MKVVTLLLHFSAFRLGKRNNKVNTLFFVALSLPKIEKNVAPSQNVKVADAHGILPRCNQSY